MPAGDSEQADLAAVLERQALLECEIAAYRNARRSGPEERLARALALRRGLIAVYVPLSWVAGTTMLFLLEVGPHWMRPNLPMALYAGIVLLGCLHLATVLARLRWHARGREPR